VLKLSILYISLLMQAAGSVQKVAFEGCNKSDE